MNKTHFSGANEMSGDNHIVPARELTRLMEAKDQSQNALYQAENIRNLFLLFTFFMPVLVTILIMVFDQRQSLRHVFEEALSRDISPLVFYTIAFLAVMLFVSMYSVSAHIRVRNATRNLKNIENLIDETYLLSPGLRLNYLQKRFLFFTAKSGRVIWIDKTRRQRSDELRKIIGDGISTLEKMQHPNYSMPPDMTILDWDDVQFMLAQWGELIGDEERELIGEKQWKVWSIGIALFYLFLLILALPVFSTNPTVFGVPFPIIIWSAIGSFAAILYRFYKSPRRVSFEIESRWLFARPLIGIVMGTLAYLALLSGLFIFSGSQSDGSADTNQSASAGVQFWIVAFLAGFSDKFYEKIIELLVGKFGAGKEFESESYVEKTESTVEIKTEKNEE